MGLSHQKNRFSFHLLLSFLSHWQRPPAAITRIRLCPGASALQQIAQFYKSNRQGPGSATALPCVLSSSPFWTAILWLFSHNGSSGHLFARYIYQPFLHSDIKPLNIRPLELARHFCFHILIVSFSYYHWLSTPTGSGQIYLLHSTSPFLFPTSLLLGSLPSTWTCSPSAIPILIDIFSSPSLHTTDCQSDIAPCLQEPPFLGWEWFPGLLLACLCWADQWLQDLGPSSPCPIGFCHLNFTPNTCS